MGNTKPFQLLEITIISAQDLEPKAKKNMRTYTTAWINPARKLTTILDTEGGSNPTWNDKFVFRVDEAFLRQDASSVQFEIYKVSWFSDTLIGTVRLLVGNLIPPPASPNHHQNFGMRFAAVQVRRPSGRPQGILNIGVAVLDSSMRSMPLYRSAASAVGYRHLMEEDNLPRHNNYRRGDDNRVLSRSRSDRSEFLGLDSASLDSAAVAVPKKRKGKRVEDDKASSILSISWFPPPPPPPIAKETNTKKKGKKVDDDKDSSVLSASWYTRPPQPPPVTTETNLNKKGKVEDDKESSILGMSWYQPPPPPPPIAAETNVNKKGNKFDDDKESSILSMSWYQPPPPPPPVAAETNVNKKGNKFDDDKESSILSMSWYQLPPPPPAVAAETAVNKKGNKVDDDKESSILSMSWFQPPPPPPPITTETDVKKGKASSVINAADLKEDAKNKSYQKGKAISVASDSIMIRDSPSSGKIGNKIEAQAENKEIVEDNKSGPRFDESPTNKTVDGKLRVGGKPNIPKIPGYDYGSSRGSRLVIGGGPYKANSIMSDSEVGPSPSEVAAAMAERPRYPLEDSVLDGWSCDESVEGLRSRLERWRTELPPLYDQVGYAPTSSSFRSSSQHTTRKRGGGGSGGGGPFSCFGNLFGYECQCVCGQPKPKSRAAKGRLRSPSPFR